MPGSGAKKQKFEDLETIEEKVNWHYQHGEGSIQDIARVYKLEVSEVLDIIGQGEMNSVRTQGDLVDASELKGTTATLNPGEDQPAQYTTN